MRVPADRVWRIADVFGRGTLEAAARLDELDPDGWTRLRLTLSWPEEVPGKLLSIGSDLEVLHPPEVRDRVLATANRIVERYRDAARSRPALSRRRSRTSAGAIADAPPTLGGSSRRWRLGFDLSLFLCLDGAGEFDQVHGWSLAFVPANFRHECQAKNTAWPLDVPKHPSGQRRFDCSSVVSMSDHRPARIAGSAAARHPAGGSTRRRSKVSLSGGPFRAGDNVGAVMRDTTRRPS